MNLLLFFILVIKASQIPLRYWDTKTADCQGVDIRELTVDIIHRLYSKQLLTVYELTQCYLNRINKLNQYLNAVLQINSLAIIEAQEQDKNFKGIERGILQGIPVLINGNIGTEDYLETTSGSESLMGIYPDQEADLVTILKRAGAIILGKTNLSELSGFLSKSAHEGWSYLGNQTINPYLMNLSPRGSSSGSAVSVATNLCVLAIGTETTNSIYYTASTSNVIGFKFTIKSLSMIGIIPLAPSLDSIVTFTRSVQDIDRVLKVFRTISLDYKSYYSSLFNQTLENYRVGIIDTFPANKKKGRFIKVIKEIQKLDQMGVELVKNISIETNELDFQQELILISHEFKYYMNVYLSSQTINYFTNPIKSFRDILNYYHNHLPDQPVDLLEMTELTDGLQAKAYKQALSLVTYAQTLITKAISDDQLDALIIPSQDKSLLKLLHLTGFPTIILPAGKNNYKPIGYTIIAPAYNDQLVLDLANLIETHSPLPRYMPTFLVK